MHAGNGLEIHFRIVERAFEIAIHTQPVHMAALGDLFFSHHRDVVFRLASYRARIAAGAGVEVNRHPPLVLLVLPLRKQRKILRDTLLFRTGEFRIFVEFGVSGGAERIALLHGLGVLSVSELLAARFPLDIDSSALPKRASPSQGVGIESYTIGDFSSTGASVAEMNSQGFVGMSGHNPYRTIHLAALELDLNHVAGGDSIALRA